MNKLIPLDAAIAALDSHAHGKTTLGGQTYRSITLGVAVDALQAIPTIDPAAIREAALKEAAEIARYFEINGVCGIQRFTGGMILKKILALIGEKK